MRRWRDPEWSSSERASWERRSRTNSPSRAGPTSRSSTRAPPRHRRVVVPCAGAGLPDQRVEDHDRARPLHRREVLQPRRRRTALLPPGRGTRGGHHPRAPDRAAAPPRLDHRLGHRVPAAEPRGVHRTPPAGGPRTRLRRPAGPHRRARQGGPRRRGPDPPRHRPWCALPRPTRGSRRRPHRGRRQRGRHRPGGDPRRHRRVLRRHLGPEDRPHGRHEPPADPARPPTRLDGPRARAGGPGRGGRPADPAPPGRRPLLPRPLRPHRHRLLRPPAHARRPRGHRLRGRRRADALGHEVHRGRLRRRLGRDTGPAARHPRCQDRGGHQRPLLLHHRRTAVAGRVTGRQGLLGRRGRVGHPLGGRGARRGRMARGRPLLVLRPARVRRQPLRAAPAFPRVRPGPRLPELRRGLRHPPPPPAGRRAAPCAPAPSIHASRSSAPSSWRPPAGSGPSGTRRTSA